MRGSTQSISAGATAAMVRCGVNIVGMDQLTPEDPRLPALVWSWATDEPGPDAGQCAYQGADGRFHAGDCGAPRHTACTDAAGNWHVTRAVVPWDRSFTVCAQFPGTSFAVPANGYRNQLVVAAKHDPGDEVWVNYRELASTWTPNLPSAKTAAAAGAGAAPTAAPAPVAPTPALGLSPQLANASRRTARDSLVLVVALLVVAAAGRLITQAIFRRGRRVRRGRP